MAKSLRVLHAGEIDPALPHLNRAWSDPAAVEAERIVGQAELNATFDRGMEKVDAMQRERWAREEA